MFQLDEKAQEVYRHFAELSLPRHTSYPILPMWQRDYGPDRYSDALRRLANEKRDISIYIHIPFCRMPCFYCGCTREIVSDKRREKSDPSHRYLELLAEEMTSISSITGPLLLRQLHLGGGTPTFLSPHQLEKLMTIVKKNFQLDAKAEISVEVDPRVTTATHLKVLREQGYNRISIGVQDFDPKVQAAVNRVQPITMVQEFVQLVRELGYSSINFDLIYGLPFQTAASMADTLEKVTFLTPERIAFYRLAVMPEIFSSQKMFNKMDMPQLDLLLTFMSMAIHHFTAAGYEFIGLDHFAKPTDILAKAKNDGSLVRGFQGMTTGRNLDVIGFGPSAISILQDAYAQNDKLFTDWEAKLAHGGATSRGMDLDRDDKLRKHVIQQIYGYGTIDFAAIDSQFAIESASYFSSELTRLEDLVAKGLVLNHGNTYRLTAPLGRLLVRVVAAIFDRYLPEDAYRTGLTTGASRVG